MSHLPGNKPLTVKLTASRGRRASHTVEPLPDAPPTRVVNPAAIIDAFKALGVTVEQLELRIGADHEKWTPDDLATLAALGKSIKAGDATTHEEFSEPQPTGGDAA